MARRVFIAIGCLVVGCVATVLVAWFGALHGGAERDLQHRIWRAHDESRSRLFVPEADAVLVRTRDGDHWMPVRSRTLNWFTDVAPSGHAVSFEWVNCVDYHLCAIVYEQVGRRETYVAQHFVNVRFEDCDVPMRPVNFNLVGVRRACGWPLPALADTAVCDDEQAYDGGYGGWLVTSPPRDGITMPDIGGRFPASHGSMLPVRPIWTGFAANSIFYAVIVWLLGATPLVIRRWWRRRRDRCASCGYPVGGSERCSECGAGTRSHQPMSAPSPQRIAAM